MIYIRRTGCSYCLTTLVTTTATVLAVAYLQFKPVECTEIKLKCSNVDEFYYAKPGSHCTSYYRCNRGQKEVKECGPGSMFDFYKQVCTRNAGVCYEPVCTGRTNGVYQDTTHACHRSFTCHAGRVISIDNCPQHHLHNGERCVSQDLVMCELPYTTAIGYPFSGDRRCTGKLDGSYGIDDCFNYVVCHIGEVADILSCPEGYRFKNEIQQCVLANQVPYCQSLVVSDETSCRNKNDGLNFDPVSTDCKTYITCNNGNFISRQRCVDQAVFNGESCVPAPLFTCPMLLNDPTNDICRRQTNGFHTDPRLGCSHYVRCMSGRTVEAFECPEGQYFDPEERNCMFEKFPERRKCISRFKSSNCDYSSQGFYQDKNQDSGCRKYFYCLNGFKTEYMCSAGKVFDGENCVPKGDYRCPSEDSNSCSIKSDGYYSDKHGGCRSYFYCSAGSKYTYLCDEGHYFDGNKCSRSTPANGCTSDNFCSGKSDGYHADLKSNCRNYVYCLNGERITQLTCRGSKIFDGNKCISPSSHTCPSHSRYQQLNCIPRCTKDCRTDGFFADYDSGCRNYFFCIEGKPSSLSCSHGQVFNGELCVPQDRYTCPIYCDDSSAQSCPLSG